MDKNSITQIPREVKARRRFGMKCDATWHLRRLDCSAETKALAIAIYFRSLQLAKPDESGVREFYVSMDELAAYYGAHWSTVKKALKALEDSGWFLCGLRGGAQKQPDGSRKYIRNPKTGRVMATAYMPWTHKQWAYRHPGECLEDAEPTAPNVLTVPPHLICGKSHRTQRAVQSSTLESSTLESTTERTACHAAGDPSPSRKREAKTHGEEKEQSTASFGRPRDWAPLAELRTAIEETTGHRVYFPRRWLPELRRLSREYGPEELLEAAIQSTAELGETFDWRGFAAWFLAGGTCSAASQILASRRLHVMKTEGTGAAPWPN